METLEHLDQQLFLFLNSLNSPFFDQLMHAISGRLIWVPLYLAILFWLAKTYKRKFLILLLFIIIAATLSDQFSVCRKKSCTTSAGPAWNRSLTAWSILSMVNAAANIHLYHRMPLTLSTSHC